MGFEFDPKAMEISFPICLGKENQLLPYTLELLEILSQNYKIFIITNGLAKVQHSRIESSPMNKYIDKLFISDEIGFAKPAKEFFEYVLKKSGINSKEQCLIIGDSLSSDIKGANNIGIDCLWYNPNGQANSNCTINYEVSSLMEIKELLSDF